jgi:BASS family bile acid:Na+ symporter
MSIDQLTNVLVTVTLVEMMAATGLGVTFGDLSRVAWDWRLVVRAALANYVLVPAATVGLLLLFGAQPLVAVGFLILAVCPGAPYGPPFAAIAKGNVPVAVGLMVLLAASSAFLAPLLLHLLLPLAAPDGPLTVSAAAVLGTLLMTQLLPLCVGMAVRRWLPAAAGRLQRPANLLSKALNLAVVGLVLAAQFRLFLEIRPRAYLGMLALLLLSWAAGWLLGGPNAALRRTMTLTASLRNVGVGLVIATGAFGGTAAVTAALVYGLVEVVGSLLLALGWARRRAANGVTPGAPAARLEAIAK